MNRETRKQLKQLNEKIIEIETDFELLKEKVDEIRSDVEDIRDEEQDNIDFSSVDSHEAFDL